MAQWEKQNYRIIITCDNKEIGAVNQFVRRDKAQQAFQRLIEENKKVVFPVKYINYKVIREAKYDLVLIKKKELPTEHSTKLRNEYGEYVEHNTSSDDWYVFDIHPYNMEETFWVYGCDPKTDRKTFSWIYENKVVQPTSDKYNFLNIILYNNKVILETFDKFNMVICKNKSDAIRMYNMIEEFSQKDKLKYVAFSGDYGATKRQATKILDEICEKTGWSRMKAKRTKTRP